VAVDVHGADRGSSSANRCGAELPGLDFKALGQVTVERPASDGDDEIGCDCGTRLSELKAGRHSGSPPWTNSSMAFGDFGSRYGKAARIGVGPEFP
jgi:hypothetical protein